MTKSLVSLKYLLITLVTTLAITGIGFLDDKIWSIIIAGIGVAAYAIVGIMYSLKLISNSADGKTAFAAIFIVLLIGGFFIYQRILKFEEWLYFWPLWVKISAISIIGISVMVLSCLYIKRKHSLKITNKSVD